MNLPACFKALVQRHLPRHSFARSVGVLAGGTALAQGIGVLALPLITRLYTPEDFSILATFSSIVAIVSVVACLRLDIAIPLPHRDEEAASLLALALIIACSVSALTGLIFLLFHNHIVAWLHAPGLDPYLWLIPIGIWLSSSYSALQFWATRKKHFSEVAQTRMTQSLGSAGAQIGGGILGIGPIGLLIGNIFSGGAGSIKLAWSAWREDKATLLSVTRRSMLNIYRHNSQFPKFSTIEALINTVGSQLPIVLIASLAAGPEAGYLSLAAKIMTAPMGLLGGSIAQVYLAHAPVELRSNRLSQFTNNVYRNLIKTGVGPLLFIGAVAEPLSRFLFGPAWGRSGELMAWMTPWFILQFLSSPVSMVMHVTGQQWLMMMTTMLGGATRVAAVLLSSLIFPRYMAEAFAVSSALIYAIYTLVFYRAAGIKWKDICYTPIASVRYLVPWIVFAVLARFFLIGIYH